MKDYSAMSDDQIAKEIAVLEALEKSSTRKSGEGVKGKIVYRGDGEWSWFDPCNNPSDSWPIILENKINIDHRESIKAGAMASQSGRKEIYAVDKNPLRASMIVFLMMKDEAVNTRGAKGMKWEILKGSEKDFDGAPEWALSVLSVSTVVGHLQAFSGAGMYQYLDGYSGNEDAGKAKEGNFASLGWRNTPKVIAERSPITEPVVNQQLTSEWSGEGFPPVGCACEFQSALGNWVAIRITAHGEDSMLMKQIGKNNEQYIRKDNKFRPIRSPEDVAVKAMCAHWNLRTDFMCKSIYEAIAAGKIPGVKLE